MYSEEKERLIELYKDGFREDSEEFVRYFFENVAREENVITREMNGEIVSCAHIVEKKVQFDDRIIDIPYLVAVSTITKMRGKRLVEKVIFDGLERMKSRHYPFVLLSPFSHEYYRKYGLVTLDREIDFKNSDILDRLDKVQSSDVAVFNRIFREYNKHYDIAIHRDVEDMRKRLDMFNVDSEDSYLLMKDNSIVGYALMYGNDVEECVLIDNSIVDIDSLPHIDNVMGRLVDIPEALQLVHFDKDVSREIVFNVHDSFFGDSKVYLSIEGGSADSHYLDNDDNSIPHIDISIEDLTRLVFGVGHVDGLEFFKKKKVNFVDKY